MSNAHKNPYNSDSPEWQLFENMVGAERLANVNYEDAHRSTQRAAEARAKADRYREALSILEAAKKGGEEPK